MQVPQSVYGRSDKSLHFAIVEAQGKALDLLHRCGTQAAHEPHSVQTFAVTTLKDGLQTVEFYHIITYMVPDRIT